jgi:hypothetical protein
MEVTIMKTLLIDIFGIKQFFNNIANSYAIIGLGYVVSIFLILFGFFGVAAVQSPPVSVQSIHSSPQTF